MDVAINKRTKAVKSTLKIANFNIQCLNTGKDELEVFLDQEDQKPEIISLTEHWAHFDCELALEGYTQVTSFCRSHIKHGGVALYVLPDLYTYTQRIEIVSTERTFECCGFLLTLGGKK